MMWLKLVHPLHPTSMDKIVLIVNLDHISISKVTPVFRVLISTCKGGNVFHPLEISMEQILIQVSLD